MMQITLMGPTIVPVYIALLIFQRARLLLEYSASEHYEPHLFKSDKEKRVPVGSSTGEKTVTVFADTNRNLQQEPGEVSATKTFTITC